MSFTVEVRGAAERDVAEAMDWYDGKVRGLGAAFLDDFDQVLRRLAETPLIYQIAHRGTRRAPLRHLPYLVWFRVRGSIVTVRACIRASVDPVKVRRRIR